ncbi:cytoplasmic aconitate hydratase-like isoform X2 [Petromyzon marinus]|uniref:aconitate hydratase n=1 Tax=Petromyzon marinus TaxID=7757 RepID=A0AAJ7T242_PETMA|nr:cytoplasmic aconitate hydratase-like isoform X1 [Petromyzon marinus]
MAAAAAAETGAENPYLHLVEPLHEDNPDHKFFNLLKLNDPRYERLPYCMRILLESAIRHCDGFHIRPVDVENILDWRETRTCKLEVPFRPARVILQDFTGIPAVVDFAAMRDAVQRLGGDPSRVNPTCPADLVIDHSVQVDVSRNAPPIAASPASWAPATTAGCADCSALCQKMRHKDPSPASLPGHVDSSSLCPFHLQPLPGPDSLQKNQELEFERNKERFQFLKWGSHTFKNMLVVPPGTGIVHQVNLEYLARLVFLLDGLYYPDSLVGTDSHTTMINGLGILGWGVGGIEAESVMLGQPIGLLLPEVVGYKLTGRVSPLATSTDVVLTITKHLRQVGVVSKFVEFFGPGVVQLSIADRATIANMCPEYGATAAFFPFDTVGMMYLQQTGREGAKMKYVEDYLKAVKLFRDYSDTSQDPDYSQVVELDLASVVPSVSGPKRPQDRVAVEDMKTDFQCCLNQKVGFKGFQVPPERQRDVCPFRFEEDVEQAEYELAHGSVVIAAITSCTNTSNPSVMLAAGLLAKKAVEAGLSVKPYIKTSLSPGSGVVTYYLNASGVLPYMEKLGFEVVGYGCMTCVGNSGPLPDSVVQAISQANLVACGVLSGNRNFEGRIHPSARANYLASPPLVIAYAIAGTVSIDLKSEPLGVNAEGKEVFLQDIWPTREEIQEVERQFVIPSMFREVYDKLEKGNDRWNSLPYPDMTLYPWDTKSTFIKSPSFFEKLSLEPKPVETIVEAHVLLFLGDSITTDHISPAGSIPRNSPAARFLANLGMTPREFNSYGARRGNDAVMTRGTFANARLLNKLVGKPGPKTLHVPSGDTLDIYDAAERYQQHGQPLVILAGKDYGSGSSRDWAAKGPYLLGVRAVLAESYDRVHRSNLVGVGIVPLQFMPEQNAQNLGLTGREKFTILIPERPMPGMAIDVQLSTGKTFQAIMRLETEVELAYYQHGGILNYMVRSLLKA